LYAALAAVNDDGEAPAFRKEKLVLRSGVGAAKQARTSPAEVADSWEEEEEKVEEEERRNRGESAEPEAEVVSASNAEADAHATDAPQAVDSEVAQVAESSQAADAAETTPAEHEPVSHDTMISS
jgi:transcriptional repressor NF-X1